MRRRVLLSSSEKDYSQEYFTMVVTAGGDVTWTGSTTNNTLSYSKNNGSTWTTANSGTTISVAAGDKVLWKGTPTPNYNGIGTFSGNTNVRYSVEGNVMSLLYGDDFKGQTSLSGMDYAFYMLFYNNTKVTSAKNLSLPATTLANFCYESMFYNCTSLTTSPVLPATTLAYSCYSSMFYGCSSLTTAPSVLPATTLAYSDYCYTGMFYNCTSLTTAPELPATTLAISCYAQMFQSCTSLTTAPELPATTLASYCYTGMFSNCTSLTIAPSLPATTLAISCYDSMFGGCTSLTTAPSLPATTLADSCYYRMFYNTNVLPDCTNIDFGSQSVVASGGLQGLFAGTKLTNAQLDAILMEHGINNYSLPTTTLADSCYFGMFYGCTSLTTAPKLPATKLAYRCYYSMFQNCTRLNSITCLATNISARNCTTNWVKGVAATGTFTKAASMSGWTTGNNGIPSGWTVETASS